MVYTHQSLIFVFDEYIGTPRAWLSTCSWLTLLSDMDVCAMAPTTSKTTDGSRISTGSNWARRDFQCHSFHRLEDQAILRTLRSIRTQTSNRLKSQPRMILSSIGERSAEEVRSPPARHQKKEKSNPSSTESIFRLLYNNNMKLRAYAIFA